MFNGELIIYFIIYTKEVSFSCFYLDVLNENKGWFSFKLGFNGN
jgi:hypothetical protein